MSKEGATKFLKAAATDTALREKFKLVASPEEFLKIALELGYSFTTEELLAVVKEHSEGITLRRKTGIWQWLRSVNWIEKTRPGEMLVRKVLSCPAEPNQGLALRHGSNNKPEELIFENNLISQLSKFEAQYRQAIDQSLNQLQTVVLLVAQLESRITNIGKDLQNLSEIVEEFVAQQRVE